MLPEEEKTDWNEEDGEEENKNEEKNKGDGGESQSATEQTTETKTKAEDVKLPSRATKRIQGLVGENKDLKRKIAEYESTSRNTVTETKTDTTPSNDRVLADRLSRLEARDQDNKVKAEKAEIQEDYDDQMSQFKSKNNLSDRDMKKLERIVISEGLTDSETNDIDFKEAMVILDEDDKADEEERKGKTSGLRLGRQTSGRTSVSTPKPVKDMSKQEIRKAGLDMLPDRA